MRMKFQNGLLNWLVAFAISGSVVVVFYGLEQCGLVFALSKWATVLSLGAVSARVGADFAQSSGGKNNGNS
jgi:hypothetical protein